MTNILFASTTLVSKIMLTNRHGMSLLHSVQVMHIAKRIGKIFELDSNLEKAFKQHTTNDIAQGITETRPIASRVEQQTAAEVAYRQ